MLLETRKFDTASSAAGGEAATLGEIYDATFDSMRLVENANASRVGLERAYDARIDAIFNATGQRLRNPASTAIDHRNPRAGLDLEPFPDLHAEFQRQLEELAANRPEHRAIIAPDRPVAEDAYRRAREADRGFEETWERSRGGAAAWAARLTAGFAGTAVDPINVVGLAAGPFGEAGRGVNGLLWMALKSGAANAGVEAAVQPFSQAWRAKAGLPHGLDMAALNIGAAFLFGAGLDAGARVAARSVRRLAGRPYLGPDPKADPIAALDAAARNAPEGSLIRRAVEGDEAAMKEIAVKTGLDADPAVRGALTELETEGLFRGVKREAVDDGEHLRQLSTALERAQGGEGRLPPGEAVTAPPARPAPDMGDYAPARLGATETLDGKPVSFVALDPERVVTDATTFQFKSEGDAAGVTARLRGVKRWDPLSAGKSFVFQRLNGELVIADGHQRLGLAKRLADQKPQLHAYLFREADGWTPADVRAHAALKNMRELSGTSVDMAKVMRERPDLVDDSLPLSDGKMREAAMLAKLSPEAFGAVVAGRLPATYAALIGDHVRDATRHTGLLDELARADLANVTQARFFLAQLMELPTTTEVQITLFGEEAVTRTVMAERARVLDASLRALKGDKRIFGLLEREAGRIAAGGNVLDREGNAARAQNAAELAELIERLSTTRGVVATLLNDAATAVARGYAPALAARAFTRRIGDLLDAEGINGLLKAADEPPAGGRIDDPNGPEVKAQVDELQARQDPDQEVMFALSAQGTQDWEAQLQAFVDSKTRSAWINGEGFKIYLRQTMRPDPASGAPLRVLDIASVENSPTGTGTFKDLLETAKTIAQKSGFEAIYVENVLTDQFADFFRRSGWIEEKAFFPGLPPSFMLRLGENLEKGADREVMFALANFPNSGNGGRLKVLMRQRADMDNRIDELRIEIDTLREKLDRTPEDEARISELYTAVDDLHGRAYPLTDEIRGLVDKQFEAKANSPLIHKIAESQAQRTKLLRERFALEEKLNEPASDDLSSRRQKIASERLAEVEQELDAVLDAIKSAHDELDDVVFALPGFLSPAIRAAEGITQEKGTGEQFWKQITKVPGVKKDELDWMGLEEFLNGKKSITKAEVLDFMRAHQVELDEKVLGGASEESVRTPVTMEQLRNSLRKDADELPEDAYQDIESVRLGENQIFIATGESQSGTRTSHWILGGNDEVIGRANSREEAVHMAEGYLREDLPDAVKFGDYKVPGGENYRELLIRLPELGERKTRQRTAEEGLSDIPELRTRLAAAQQAVNDAVASGADRHLVSDLRDEANFVARMIKDIEAPVVTKEPYVSKHFNDQEIVHLRVDDRVGPNGEKVLFVNEVQSDLHQQGQLTGYTEESYAAALNAAIRRAEEIKAMPYSREVAERLGAAQQKVERIQNYGGPAANAPIKGDLWLELGLKRALLYASENGYDAVSWARSDQIAKAVGADPEGLKLQYDQKIGKFLDKYTKKWDGKVEEFDFKKSFDPERYQVSEQIEALRTQPQTPERDAQIATLRARGQELMRMKIQDSLGGPNGLLRITPEMRASVMAGQPLFATAAQPVLSRSAPSPRYAAGAAALRGDIDKAVSKMLPPSWRHEVRDTLVYGSRSVDGYADPYERIIYVSLAATDPLERTFEESGHALRAAKLIPAPDYDILRTEGRRLGAREHFDIDARYGETYGQRWQGAALEDRLEEEAIMQMIAAHARGKTFGEPSSAARRILDRIVKFLRGVGEALRGRGFRTYEDVFEDMTSGRMARPQLPEIAEAGRVQAMRDALTATSDRSADEDGDTSPAGAGNQSRRARVSVAGDQMRAAALDADGNEIGFVSGTIKGDTLVIGKSTLQVQLQGKGNGLAMYQALVDGALGKGLKVASANEVSESASRMYSALEKRGYAVDALPHRIEEASGGRRIVQTDNMTRAPFIITGKRGDDGAGDAMLSLGDGTPPPDIRDVINGAAAEGRLSREDAAALLQRLEALERHYRDNPAEAAQALRAEVDAEALRRQRVALLQDQARARNEAFVTEYRDARGQPDPAKATIALLEHHGQTTMPAGASSVVGRRQAILGMSMAQMEGALHEFRRTWVRGATRNTARLENMVREAFGDGTGDQAAAGFARVWAEVAEELRQRFNAAGGHIGQLKSWGLPQHHDRRALLNAGMETWISHITPRLDLAAMRNVLTGGAMTAADLRASLEYIWRNITADGWIEREPSMARFGIGMVANQRADHRFLHFRNADAWLEYQSEFGGGADPFAAMMGHIRGMAEDIAAMEILGPNPRGMLTWLQQFTLQQAALRASGQAAHFPAVAEITGRRMAAAGNWLTTKGAEDYARNAVTLSDNMWDIYRGAAGAVVNQRIADTFGTVRNTNVASKLGGAALSAVTDLGFQKMARSFAGLPVTRSWGDVFRAFQINKRDAVRGGLILDTASNILHQEARWAGAMQGPEWSAYLADRVIASTGLAAWTQAGKHAFGLSVQAELASRAGEAFADLPQGLRRLFGRYGLAAADWEAMRAMAAGDPDFLTPQMVQASGAPNLAERYLEMILQETEYAVPTGGLKAQALSYGGLRRGVARDEFWRSAGQFKMFGLSVAMLQGQRIAAEIIQNGGWRGAGYAAGLMITTTLYGALAIQLKELGKGRDPREMTDTKFWGHAILQSGGLGIYGDFLFAETNRVGGGLARTLVGPTADVAAGVLALGPGNAAQWVRGEKTNTGREIVRFLAQNTPGGSNWYLRLAYERVLLENLQRLADPEAHAAFRRKIQMQKRDYGNEFFWAPGRDAPSRGPELGRAFGGR